MSLATANFKKRTIGERLSGWYRRMTRPSRDRSLDALSEAEVKHLADDVGVSASELRALNRQRPEAADLLNKRMKGLALDSTEVSRVLPVTMHDMQRLCSLCIAKRKCARDLNSNSHDPSWKDYCPNADALGDLDAMPWEERRDW